MTALLIVVLALWVDTWLACLIVTAVYAVGAAVLVLAGKAKMHRRRLRCPNRRSRP